jgi:galactose-1-phosphate uridylyltransferase
LLEDYVNVYEQAIEGLQDQLDTATEEFEEITEEKRLREEEAKANAAQKAKESEYDNMTIAVNEAKADMDTAQQAYNDAVAALALCEVEDCSEPQGVVDAALEELNLYKEIFNAAD